MPYEELDGNLDERALLTQMVLRGPIPAMAFDRQGHLLFINEVASLLLGLRGERKPVDLLASEFFADPQQWVSVRRDTDLHPAGDSYEIELQFRDMRGEPIPVRAWFEALRREGVVVGYTTLFIDVRELVVLNRRLEDTTRQLLNVQERSSVIERGKSVAHQLNQPLTVAMGTLELLTATSTFTEPVMARLERVYEQLQRMARIVRRISMPAHQQAAFDEPK